MKKYNLSMNNIVECDGKMFFLAFSTNTIFEMNGDMSHCHVMTRIPQGVQKGELPQYEGIYIYKKKLVVLPDTTKRIVIYDFNDGAMRYLDYPKSNYLFTPFWGGVIYKKYLYILPCTHDKLFKLDLDNEQLEEINLNGIVINRSPETCAWGAIAFCGNKIVFTSMNEKKILSLNIDNDVMEDVTPYGLHEEFAGIVYLDDRYWVVPKQCDRIIILNDNFDVISVRYIDVDGYSCDVWSFAKLQVIDSYIYMLPRRANTFMRYSVKDDKFEVINIKDIIKPTRLDKFMPVSNVWKKNGNTYFAHSSSGKIYKIVDGSIVECHIDVESEYIMSYKGIIAYENTEFDGLNEFLDTLSL